MVFVRPSGSTVTFGPIAVASLEQYRQMASAAKEAGGILLGRLVLETHDIIVDQVTVPTKGDRRSRFSFWRARAVPQRRVIALWKVSAGTQNYLGEWHTHPEDDPQPSPTDLANWSTIIRSAKYEQGSLLFAVIGRNKTRLWELKKTGGVLSELMQKEG